MPKDRLDFAIRGMLVATPIAGAAGAWLAWNAAGYASLLSSVAGILVAAGTFELAWVAILQIRQLNRQWEVQQEASFRPILIPDGVVPPESLWNGPEFHLHVKNVGPGLASNVEAVLLPPVSGRKTIPPLFYAEVPGPIPGGGSVAIMLRVGGYMIAEDDSISAVPLAVPAERAPTTDFPDPRRTQPICTARLTITSSDLLGIKHASFFDWPTSGGWLSVKVVSHASADLETIDASHRAR